MDWLSRATNWAKLTATASLGVIHRGHEKEALALMAAYLPREVAAASAGYSEGGGLYALGLIHANHGSNITDYLLQQLKEASNEVRSSIHLFNKKNRQKSHNYRRITKFGTLTARYVANVWCNLQVDCPKITPCTPL